MKEYSERVRERWEGRWEKEEIWKMGENIIERDIYMKSGEMYIIASVFFFNPLSGNGP